MASVEYFRKIKNMLDQAELALAEAVAQDHGDWDQLASVEYLRALATNIARSHQDLFNFCDINFLKRGNVRDLPQEPSKSSFSLSKE